MIESQNKPAIPKQVTDALKDMQEQIAPTAAKITEGVGEQFAPVATQVLQSSRESVRDAINPSIAELANSVAQSVSENVDTSMFERVQESVTEAIDPSVFDYVRDSMNQMLEAVRHALITPIQGDTPYRRALSGITQDMATNPYSRESRALFNIEELPGDALGHFAMAYSMANKDLRDEADRLTDGGIGRFHDMASIMLTDYQNARNAINSGDYRPNNPVLIEDQQLEAIGDIARFMFALIDDGYTAYKNTEIEEVLLAQFSVDKMTVNHSLAMKAVDGLWDIAMGKPYADINPKGGKSREAYKVTASEDACTRFFAMGGNVEYAKCVADTAYTLKNDPRSATLIYNGRVWFTTNAILKAIRETRGGKVSGKDNDKERELVKAALLALSGGQIVGRDPSGNILNTIYVIDAVYRSAVTHKGQVYKDVWGFTIENNTLGDYAKSIGQSYDYPKLQRAKPLTNDEAWIRRYLIDALNKAFGELYSVDKFGHAKKRQKRMCKVKKSWAEIFEKASPLRPLDSRKKKRLVQEFETHLKALAQEAKDGELKDGRPLYIKAYSERNPSKGRGKGEWINLVIDCYSDTHAPEIDLL